MRSLLSEFISLNSQSIPIHFALPGPRRQDSVFNGFNALTKNQILSAFMTLRVLLSVSLWSDVFYRRLRIWRSDGRDALKVYVKRA